MQRSARQRGSDIPRLTSSHKVTAFAKKSTSRAHDFAMIVHACLTVGVRVAPPQVSALESHLENARTLGASSCAGRLFHVENDWLRGALGVDASFCGVRRSPARERRPRSRRRRVRAASAPRHDAALAMRAAAAVRSLHAAPRRTTCSQYRCRNFAESRPLRTAPSAGRHARPARVFAAASWSAVGGHHPAQRDSERNRRRDVHTAE